MALTFTLSAQIIFTDDFSAVPVGILNGQNGWATDASSGGGGGCSNCDANRVKVASISLTPPVGSAVGFLTTKALQVNMITPFSACGSSSNPGGDAPGRLFTSVNSGTVYVSCLLRIDRPSGAQGDVFRVALGGFSTSFRLMTRGSGMTYKFYLQTNSNNFEVTDNVTRTTGETYAIVVKYTFPTGGNNQGRVDLFVNPTTSTEPTPTLTRSAAAGGSSLGDPTSMDRILFPFNSTCVNRPDFTMACLKVGKTWGDVIPVELVNFLAKATPKSNLLTWTTASERNLNRFDIERSANGINAWQILGTVKATGNSQALQTYAFSDETPLPTAYYRLHAIDNDGKSELSKIINVNRDGNGKLRFTKPILSLYTEGSLLNLDINTARATSIAVTITDLLGRAVAAQTFRASEGDSQIQVPISALAKGVYLVNVTDSETSLSSKITKQ